MAKKYFFSTFGRVKQFFRIVIQMKDLGSLTFDQAIVGKKTVFYLREIRGDH